MDQVNGFLAGLFFDFDDADVSDALAHGALFRVFDEKNQIAAFQTCSTARELLRRQDFPMILSPRAFNPF